MLDKSENMENYYNEIIEEIKNAMNKGEIEEADYLLKKELSMPYIPQDVEETLHKLKKDLAYAKSDKRNLHEESLEDLLSKLRHGKAQSQLAAANALQDRNLRSCVEELQNYLGKDPCPEAAALIIEALAEQEIDDEFTLKKDGIEYTFFADEVVPVTKSKGLLKALDLLQDEYLKNPSVFQLAKSILIHKVYLYLPLTYEEEEAEYLKDEIVQEIENLLTEIEENDKN